MCICEPEIPVYCFIFFKGKYAQSSLSYWSLVRCILSNTFSVTSGVADDAKFSLCCFAILISVATVDSYSNIKQVI